MKTLIYIAVCFLSGARLCQAQGFTKNYFLDSLAAGATDAIEAPNGNLIVTGINYEPNAGAYVLSVLGTDSIGNVLWRKNYGNKNQAFVDNILCGRSLCKMNGGFFYYSGVRDSNNTDFSVVMKFDFLGDTLWQRTYKVAVGQLYIQDATQNSDGGLFLTGLIQNTPTGTSSFLIKTDAQGNELWRRLISTPGLNIQEGRCVLQDSASKRIVMVGCQANGSPGIWEYYNNIIVCDSLGTLQQRYSIPSNCGGFFQDMVQTKDKKFVAVGAVSACNPIGGTNRYKSYALKFDIDSLDVSKALWQRTFDTLSYANAFTTINELPSGDLVLSGVLDTIHNYGLGFVAKLRLIKLDKNGHTIWHKTYGSSNLQENSKRPKSLNLCKDGGFLLANDLVFAFNPRPYTITKIDSMGCDSTLAYCNRKSLVSSAPEQTEFRLFPNPSAGTVFFQVPGELMADSSGVTLAITDMMGRQVFKHILSSAKAELNLAFLASGVYMFTAYKHDKKEYITKLVINPK